MLGRKWDATEMKKKAVEHEKKDRNERMGIILPNEPKCLYNYFIRKIHMKAKYDSLLGFL